MLKILVTGGAGFIGSHVVDRLLEEGCEVKVLDDFSNGRLSNIENQVRWGEVKLFEGSILDKKAVRDAVKGVDTMIHLAAITSVPMSVLDPGLTFHVNVDGTALLLDQCIHTGVQRFLLGSSCAVYGQPQYLPIDELHPVNPLSPYAESKLEAEARCLRELDSGLTITILRFFNVYGLRQSTNGYAGVISSFCERLLTRRPLVIHGDGLQTRDFVHVSDIAEATWQSLKARNVEGVYNIASGSPVSIKELAETMIELLGRKSPPIVFGKPREGDIRSSQGDFSKANMAFGYQPRTELREGLAELLLDVQAPGFSLVEKAVA